MGRIVLISQRHDNLVPLIMKQVPDAVATTNFKFELEKGDVLCWLPTINEYVDDEVQELAGLVDQSIFPPAKIVMLSIAGTADDTTDKQLHTWYGKKALEIAYAHQYAIKMIDELELPYTIVRTLPLINGDSEIRIVKEGQLLTGKNVGINQVAQVIKRAVTTDDFYNQSIGIAPLESGQ